MAGSDLGLLRSGPSSAHTLALTRPARVAIMEVSHGRLLRPRMLLIHPDPLPALPFQQPNRFPLPYHVQFEDEHVQVSRSVILR